MFALRKVKEQDLIARAGKGLPQARKGPGAEKILNADLSEMFAIEMAQVAKPRAATRAPAAAQTRATSTAKSSKSTRQATASAKILQEEAARLRDTKNRRTKTLRRY